MIGFYHCVKKKFLKAFVLLLVVYVFIFVDLNDQFQYQYVAIRNHKSLSAKSVLNIKSFSELHEKILLNECNVNIIKINSSCLNSVERFYDKNGLSKKFSKKNDCAQCLQSGKENIIIYHHTFWQLKNFNPTKDEYYVRIMKLNIMSYLVTQNPCCTRFILWKLTNFPNEVEEELKRSFKLYFQKKIIEIREFSLLELCKNDESSFKRTIFCLESDSINLNDGKLVALSDLVRFMVLDLYGGIYTDGDVVYLKDLQPLWSLNFAYRWSAVKEINTAILGINRSINPSINDFYSNLLYFITPDTLIKKIITFLGIKASFLCFFYNDHILNIFFLVI
jgi:hypothetical protein